MPTPINKVSVLLNGGIDENSVAELGGPVAQQGQPQKLKKSVNTRLGKKHGSCARAPRTTNRGAPASGAAIHALIPAEAGKNILALTRGASNQILDRDGIPYPVGSSYTGNGPVRSQNQATTIPPAASFLPAQIAAAGAGAGEPGIGPMVSCYQPSENLIYHAYPVARKPVSVLEFDVVMYATRPDGTMVLTPRVVLAAHAAQLPMALTAHGTDGVRLWLRYYPNNAFQVRTVSRPDKNEVTLSAPTNLTIGAVPLIVSGLLVTSAGAADTTYAKYAFHASGATIYRIDVTTYATTSVATGLAGNFLALTFAKTSYAGYVVGSVQVDVASPSPSYLVRMSMHSAALTLVGSNASGVLVDEGANLAVSAAACQFVDTPTDKGLVCLTEHAFTGAGVKIEPEIASTYLEHSTWAAGLVSRLPWMLINSRGASVYLSSTDLYPVFDLVRCYGNPVEKLPVQDPDVQLWFFRRLRSPGVPSARYGSVRGVAAPAHVEVKYEHRYGAPVVTGLASVFCSYRQQALNVDTTMIHPGFQYRWLSIDFTARPLAVAHDRDGLAMAAGALPVQWDGAMPTELGGPLYVPCVAAITTTDYQYGFPAGDYIVGAIYHWTDAAGLKHRSTAAFKLLTLTTAQSMTVSVSVPTATFRDGVFDVDVHCSIYVSSDTDTTLHLAVHKAPRVDAYYKVTINGPPPIEAAVLYSSGELGAEQMPQPPPPLWDIAIVADRCFGIDAEHRSRIVHTKRRISGIGYEWHPAYEILLPSGAGPAMAVREWRGSIVVFAKNGVYGISGDGPDNLIGNPSGGNFSKPQKVGDVGCTNRDSVISTPAGILFQRDAEMMFFAGAEPQALPEPDLEANIVGAALFRDQDEAVFYLPARQVVFNYVLARWTSWTIAPGTTAYVAGLSYDTAKLLLANTANTITHVDSTLESTDAFMSWETDWVALTGDFQDHVLVHSVVLSARSTAPHTVRIDVLTNYADTPSTTRTVDVSAIDNAEGRYTIKLQPQDRGTRAVKVRVTEVTLGIVPICLTFYFSTESDFHDAALPPGAFV